MLPRPSFRRTLAPPRCVTLIPNCSEGRGLLDGLSRFQKQPLGISVGSGAALGRGGLEGLGHMGTVQYNGVC